MLEVIITKVLGFTVSEIAVKTGLSRRQVRASVDRLLLAGKLMPVDRFRYASRLSTPDEARMMKKIMGGKKRQALWRQLRELSHR